MFLKHSTKVLHIHETCFHRDIQHAVSLFQEHRSLFQTDESHEILRSLPCQCLQLAIKERTAHRHLPAKAVDGEVGVAQVIENETGLSQRKPGLVDSK